DSLQTLIKDLDGPKLKGWIIDVRNNNGGAEMPMIAGLGPLLDKDNVYYGIDKSGTIRTLSYYRNGAYYNVDDPKDSLSAPIVATKVKYQLHNPKLPVIILTSGKTASSAEAVVAIFRGQPNVKIVGEKTNGLTTINSFEFLEDNSVLNLSMANMAGRDKKIYVQGIAPDLLITPMDSERDDIVLQNGIALIVAE
ncbi:MAG: S41 family peptidase, partial [Cyclobacteriaceae bacterium]